MYPDLTLPPEIVSALRNDAATAEFEGRLSPAQMDLIFQQRWFHLFVPGSLGGLALSLPEAVRLEESIAYADGSVGWVVTLCAGAGMFVGFMEDKMAQEVFAHPRVCLAGSGQSTGRATTIHGGYCINGSWPYASGAADATHFTANCLIDESGETKSFIFKREEVMIEPDWHYTGLNATAGHAYSVKDVEVPSNRSFIIAPEQAILPDPVYRYPFIQLAETTIAANTSGMCLYFFELAKQLLTEKQPLNARSGQAKAKGLQLINLGIAEMKLLRGKFYTALERSWLSLVNHDNISAADLKAVSQHSIHLAKQSRNLVNLVYPYCGMEAARVKSSINRVWRNINTASQHSLLLDLS